MKRFLRYLSLGLVLICSATATARTVVAIDAGHGGKDGGATGKVLGLEEKAVTLSIAKELKALFDADPNFKAVMTRKNDRFIPLPERSEIARKNRANYLISIHVNSSPTSTNIRGVSVWVLSNKRASDELGRWLEDHEKQSDLLGGAGSVLSNANERYLSQTVLDLQFSHSQQVGYRLGQTMLNHFAKFTHLDKSVPQHASLSVLRSPDIPSILIETGYLSNPTEEQKLSSIGYRRQVARVIYNGLAAYHKQHSATLDNGKKAKSQNDTKQSEEKVEKKSDKPKKAEKQAVTKTPEKAKTTSDIDLNATHHKVQPNETLYSIARMYNTTPEKLIKLNQLKDNKIIVGKKLKLK